MADRKTTELTEATTAALTALVAIVEDPAGTPDDKKITLGNLLASLLDVRHAKLGADVAINSGNNVWVTGVSLELPAGNWLVMAQITLIKAATTICNFQARLSDGTTHYASAQIISPSNNPQGSTQPLITVIELASTTTVNLQATTPTAAASVAIRAATATNGSGNNATQITALRIG